MGETSMTDHTARIDITRHAAEFDPDLFGDRRVDIIGCGAVGAGIADLMGRNGVRNIHLWDGDTIETHNVANQRPYVQADIGKPKVEALAAHLIAAGAYPPTVHAQFITESETLGDIVFLAVDTMAARKKIFADCIRLKYLTKYVIECRMGVDELRVYGFCPQSRSDVAEWTQSLYDDPVTVPGVCQAQTTLNDVVGVTAGIAVARFRHWYRKEVARDPAYAKPLPVEQVVLLRPLLALCN
jgi:molybdopterin/thiamine biosynthesis adenylyltransferase